MENWQLAQRQSLPLPQKIRLSEVRIKTWHEHWEGETYVSFSGGKDSTVLLHLVREIYPNTPAVFVNTGLEYPEIVDFVRTIENVIWLKPTKNFKRVLEEHGYPVVSKSNAQKIRQLRTLDKNSKSYILRNTGVNSKGVISPIGKLPEKWRFLVHAPFKISERCCDVMKKTPFKSYEKKTGRHTYTGNMAADSQLRRSNYLKHECNRFTGTPVSTPLGFWLEQDIWKYLDEFNVPYSEIYNKGTSRTGCMFCLFGLHMEKEPNRFQRMYETHPKQWKFCMKTLGLSEVLQFLKIPSKPRRRLLIEPQYSRLVGGKIKK